MYPGQKMLGHTAHYGHDDQSSYATVHPLPTPIQCCGLFFFSFFLSQQSQQPNIELGEGTIVYRPNTSDHDCSLRCDRIFRPR